MKKVSSVDASTGKMVLRNQSKTGRILNPHYEGANTNRFMNDWVTQNASIDSFLENSLVRLRARASQLVGSDGYADLAEDEVVSNLLGEEGFSLKVNALNKRGGKDKKAGQAVKAAWKEFGRAENYSVTKEHTEHEFDSIMLRSIFRKGGALARMVEGFPNNGYRFALQGMNMDLLDPEFHDNGRNIQMSVQRDSWGAVSGYHVLKHHPGDGFRWGASPGEREFFSADEIIHPFLSEEFGQTQGKPWLTPVIPRLRQLHAYEEAEVIAARAHASKIFFFETDANSPAGGYRGEGFDEYGNIKMDGSAGSGENLPPGVKANFIDPTHPNANYPDFRKGMLRGISAGLVTSYNILGQDLEGVSYSSIRSGTLSERDMWRLLQRWYIEKTKRPVFQRWLKWALLTGKIEGYDVSDFDRLNHGDFTGRRWEWVDPDKDSKAEERRLKMRLTSHQRIARKRGEDLEEILDEIAEDNEAAEARQLDLFLDIEGPQPAGAQPEPQEAEE